MRCNTGCHFPHITNKKVVCFMKKQRKKKLLNRFGIYISTLIGFFLLSFFSMFIGIKKLDNAQKLFMERLMAEKEVDNALNKMDEYLQVYRNSWQENELMSYEGACQRLKETLTAYNWYAADSPDTQNYIRRLNGFVDYQSKLLSNLSSISQRDLYDLASYIDTSITKHQHSVKEMAQIDLEHSRSSYQVEAETILHWITVTVVLSIIFLMIFGLWSIRVFSFVHNVMNIVNKHLWELASRNWNMPDLLINDYLEFEKISKTLNMMKNQIKDYIIQTERDSMLTIQLKEERLINETQRSELIAAKMSALRAQVNPHFLFNALNLIGSAALVDTPEMVLQLVEATGKILRYSLYTNENMVLLDDEVEIVQQYLFLQKHRFGDSLEINLSNRLEGEELMIPPMSIQPIVENCFKHGFGQQKELCVNIVIFSKDDYIIIQVIDNGVGFISDLSRKKGGIGLSNIEKRLNLQYGGKDQYLFIASHAGYTNVTLKIPIKEQDLQ